MSKQLLYRCTSLLTTVHNLFRRRGVYALSKYHHKVMFRIIYQRVKCSYVFRRELFSHDTRNESDSSNKWCIFLDSPACGH